MASLWKRLPLFALVCAASAFLAAGALAACSNSSTTDDATAPAPIEAPGTGTPADENSDAEAAPEEEPAASAEPEPEPAPASEPFDLAAIPAYSGSPFAYIDDGEPSFSEADRTAAAGTERYGELDELGRCTDTFAVVGPETMPTEKRGDISEVKPTGWQSATYDFVDGESLYNRCHLLGFQLTGENANERNLITGTRYMNTEGMLPFENAVADYVHATDNHVLMRVTPIFEGDEPVARGVQMQAESLEDGGDGVSFNVFCYNVQPGVTIDYATGDNHLDENAAAPSDASDGEGDEGAENDAREDGSDKGESADANASDSKNAQEYVLNTNTGKFHEPSCSSVKQMKNKNRQDVKDTRENIINQGYEPCKRCNP